MMVKHPTASVFLLGRFDNEWRLGLVLHPRFLRWMLPGGHVEEYENPAQAALREVKEETGLDATLLPALARVPVSAQAVVTVPAPLWTVEQQVPPDSHLPHAHIHVDHLYTAIVAHPEVATTGAHPFAWYGLAQLAHVKMFDGSRVFASTVIANLDVLLADDVANGGGRLG